MGKEARLNTEQVVQQLRARIQTAHRQQPSFVDILTIAADRLEELSAQQDDLVNVCKDASDLLIRELGPLKELREQAEAAYWPVIRSKGGKQK